MEKHIEHNYTVTAAGPIEHRETTVYSEEGKELVRQHHRRVLEPDQDTSAETEPRLLAIIGAVWTDDVKAAYAAQKKQAAERERGV